MQVLSRRTKNNPVLIGEPGVGKTAIVEGLAQRIIAGDVPEESARQDASISLDLGSMVAGARSSAASSRNDSRPSSNDIKNSTPTARSSLFIDELHTIVGAGAVRVSRRWTRAT